MPRRKAVRPDDGRLRKGATTPRKKTDPGGVKGPRSRMDQYLAGELKVKDMTDKELAKGRWAGADGKFKGQPPKMMPKKFFDELRAETIIRWNAALVEDLEPMKQVLRDIALNRKASADARHKSAIYLIERVVGKVPEKSEVKLEVAKWEEDIEGVLYSAPEPEEAK